MITIKKMAEIIGTSTTTVSNVIHGKTSEVSPAMIKKVKKVLEEYNYVPNINASNLASNQSRMIGLAMNASKEKYKNFIQDPFAGEFTGAIESRVRKRGYFTMLYISDSIPEIMNTVTSWNMDGLILFGFQKEDGLIVKKKVKKPVVFVDSYFDGAMAGYANVGLEDRKGSYDITKYLIEKGHRKIAFLADNSVGSDYERLKGYQDALLEAGIACDEDKIIMLKPREVYKKETLNQLYEKSKELTALVCASDYHAVHILNELMDRGVRIPEDLSIVGFDDNIYSKIVRPRLTTVHQDVSEKGYAAVDTLFHMINGDHNFNKDIRLPVHVVERDSVRDIW